MSKSEQERERERNVEITFFTLHVAGKAEKGEEEKNEKKI